ncbi:DUF2188 domain-containing protein [Alkalicoccus urumqiensis]|uniref:DUF2188 domain-containing protein n=1 Tax=Alkalicoccus urumqiensis TaxID=1548213 RepID=A0A2P6MI89_ALKUR|nr:DUF2188 domain-containing protein [Alkalicoccus urumqiensis]PRO65980.1 hypothetical protein C6I21_06660 [Alkalicoccus urumqiensis]
MPWTMNDYPSSLKNLPTLVRKKAIDIANTMLEEGYKEGDAIPIATEQAKKWHEDASEQEKKELEQASQKEIKQADGDSSARPELNEKNVLVEPHENGWAVRTRSAEQASDVFDKKEDAVNRAKEIAENKETRVEIFKHDGSHQEDWTPSSR